MIEMITFNCRATEVDAATRRIIGAYKKQNLSNDAYLPAMIERLEEGVEKLSSSIYRSKAESELEEKDQVRDEKLRAVYYLVNGLSYHPSPDLAEAAEQVKKAFDRTGLSIVKESYAVESSLIQSLLSKWSHPVTKKAIDSLSGCAENIARLETAQTDFESSRIAYEEEKARENGYKNATRIKKELLDIINKKLVVYLSAMVLTDNTTYGNFSGTIQEIITSANEAVKKRMKKPEEV